MSNQVNHQRDKVSRNKYRAQRGKRRSNLVGDPRRDIGRNKNDQRCHSKWKTLKRREERRELNRTKIEK